MHPADAEPVSVVVVTPGADGAARVTDLRNPAREEYAAPYPVPPPEPEPPPPLPPPKAASATVSRDGLVAVVNGEVDPGYGRLRWQVATVSDPDPGEPAHWRDLAGETNPTLSLTAAVVEVTAPSFREGVTFALDGGASFTGSVCELHVRLLAARDGDGSGGEWSASDPVTVRRVRALG